LTSKDPPTTNRLDDPPRHPDQALMAAPAGGYGARILSRGCSAPQPCAAAANGA